MPAVKAKAILALMARTRIGVVVIAGSFGWRDVRFVDGCTLGIRRAWRERFATKCRSGDEAVVAHGCHNPPLGGGFGRFVAAGGISHPAPAATHPSRKSAPESDEMHSIQRRRLLLAAGASLAPATLLAQSYPSKPIRLIVPFPAAGATDILSRELARRLSDRLGQQVVVDNRPGAGGTIGSEAAAKSPPDGYTLLMATSSTHSIGPQLNPKLPYNAQTDFTPVAHVANAANVLIVSPKLEVKNVRELIALARAKPGSLNYGSSGNGTIPNLTGELFKAMTGIYIVHIPYRGTALVIPDMVTGQVQLMFDSIVSAQPHLKDGRVRPLAVTSLTRSPLLPEVPPLAETVPGFESVTWFGVFGPRGLPPEVVQKINAEINALFKQPDFAERLRQLGAEPAGGTPADFARAVADDSAKWAKLIRERKIAAD
jgi:tripartite-type tricarboxylate transporter receptor subunit TctC